MNNFLKDLLRKHYYENFLLANKNCALLCEITRPLRTMSATLFSKNNSVFDGKFSENTAVSERSFSEKHSGMQRTQGNNNTNTTKSKKKNPKSIPNIQKNKRMEGERRGKTKKSE